MLAKRIRRGIGQFACATLVALLAACGLPPVGPGFYRVESGDTVSKIARDNRQPVQNIVRWNGLSNPNAIEVGQVLRVAPPASTSTAAAPAATAATAPAPRASRPARPTAPDTPPKPTAVPATSISLIWPTNGKVIRTFDGRDSKGIDIVNAAGTPVIAAAAGKVVYAGNGLRGYGNLLILKHNGDYLTAYAHNQALLVKEGQAVTQGQQIAQMGNSDNDRVMLHFELRYQGRSIDPARELPPR
ncbi:peptidoglycan DD-metalloendopeptidase family protein [Paraburkholderia denitrificans]|uniref:Peptidoglycan DD-metalloendopeptidase family protein n=1 Tax=Paraburkholderia denitrificans TaxID=694025 RepID=A0ABW0J2G5_9BURK